MPTIIKATVRKPKRDKRIYTNIVDLINNKTYSVKVPYNYLPISLYFIEMNTPPIEEYNNTSLCLTKVSIRHLVDLHHNKLIYEIVNDKDVIDILKNLYAYIEYAENIKHLNQDIEIFLSRVKNLTKEIYEMYKVIEKKMKLQNKPLKDKINPLYNAIKAITSLYR